MKGELVECIAVDEATRRGMFELFAKQFDNVPLAQFLRDLDQKNRVLLLRSDGGELTGFSSMHIYDLKTDGRDLTIVYSGDTVVDPDTWQDSALSYYWMGAIDYLRRLCDRECLYWFLLVSGYRTYRFLPVYSRSFYPRFDYPTPPHTQCLIDELAHERFGKRYDAATGVVRLHVPAILRDPFRGIPAHRLADPHVAFFAERNPGHERGDELVCFAELAEDKLTRLGRRMWRKGKRLFANEIGT